jgi:hypothetical protein
MKMTLDLLQEVIHFLQSASMIIQIVSAALSFFVILFVFRFMIPAMWMHIQFNSVIRRLRRIKRTKGGDIASVFERNKTLHHLWTEYEHTIHKQYAQTFKQFDSDQSPSAEVILRSTAPASTIFTTEALVDSRLSTEFFKHLPGLFTGIGIIGTFSGLIQGLRAFKVSENATEVRTSLEVLMHGVSEAFLVSAVAIAAAMVATVLERWLIAGLYRKAEAITFEIDGMFQSGVGEEYLERLVNGRRAPRSISSTMRASSRAPSLLGFRASGGNEMGSASGAAKATAVIEEAVPSSGTGSATRTLWGLLLTSATVSPTFGTANAGPPESDFSSSSHAQPFVLDFGRTRTR